MSKPEMVDIVNGDLTAQVQRKSLHVWEANGWTLAETGDNEPVPSSAPVKPAVAPAAVVKPDTE